MLKVLIKEINKWEINVFQRGKAKQNKTKTSWEQLQYKNLKDFQKDTETP